MANTTQSKLAYITICFSSFVCSFVYSFVFLILRYFQYSLALNNYLGDQLHFTYSIMELIAVFKTLKMLLLMCSYLLAKCC